MSPLVLSGAVWDEKQSLGIHGISRLPTSHLTFSFTANKPRLSSSVLLTDDSQAGLTSHYGLSDDTSSRALTESDSPGIPDDIIMYESFTDSEGT